MANQLTGALRIARVTSQAAPSGNAGGDTSVPVAGLAAASAADAGAGHNADVAVYRRAADIFGQMSSRIGEMADHARAREGEAAGALAGFDKEFRPKGDHTIFAEAFDRAAIGTYKSKMSAELASQLDEAYARHENSPAGLTKALAAVREGWHSQIDPALSPHVLPEFEAQFARQSTGLVRQATRNHQEIVRADQAASLQNELASRMKSVEQQAFRLGLDATADKALAGEMASLRASLSARGPDGRPLVAPGTQVKLLADAEEQVVRSRLIGAFQRLGGREEKERFIAGIEAGYMTGSNKLLNTLDVRSYETLVGHLRSEAARQNFGDTVAARQLARDIKTFEKAAEDGLALSETQMAELKGRLATQGTPELIENYNAAASTLATVKQLQVLRPEQIERFTQEERQRLLIGGVDVKGGDLARLQLAEKYLESLKTDITQDPLGRAGRDGLTPVPALDFSSGETLASSLGQRVPLAGQVADHYGRDVKYFRPEERQQIAAAARQGDQKLLSLASAITAGLGENAPAALAEIAPEAPELAHIAGLNLAANGEPPQAAKDAARGVSLRTAKDFKPLAPGPKEARAVAVALTGDAFAALPATESAAIAVANSIYEVRARRENKTEFDPDLWQQGYREALGERTINGETYGGLGQPTTSWFGKAGEAVVIPPNIKRQGFRDLIDSVTLADLTAVGGAPLHSDGKPASIDSVRRARLVQVGDGAYRLSLGDAEDPKYLANGRGEEYVLDLKALQPLLRQKRPDLYLGGQ